MAAPLDDALQHPYLADLDLRTKEHLTLYSKAIAGLDESERYDLTKKDWLDFYQVLEEAAIIYGFDKCLHLGGIVFNKWSQIHCEPELIDHIHRVGVVKGRIRAASPKDGLAIVLAPRYL